MKVIKLIRALINFVHGLIGLGVKLIIKLFFFGLIAAGGLVLYHILFKL